ncbi:uncharacterized protein [Physcomitrium patens]|uniref:uncharacterized protein n=1 Tax=Physcomitrium patens TaxID=3218 RepID=UPI003CCDA6A3
MAGRRDWGPSTTGFSCVNASRTAEPKYSNTSAVNGEDSQNGFQDKRRSKRVESWARARFDAWRALHKRPTAEAIEDLCDHDRKELEELVELFLTQVCKQNGKEYPHQTIGSLLRALGRVTRAHQEARIAETQVPEAPLNIMSDVRFKKAGQAVSDNVASAGRLGLGKRRKCISILTLLDEAAMLALSTYKCTSAKGCSMRFAYFCTQKFFIRGTAELHELTDMDFTLGKDQHGEFLRHDFHSILFSCFISLHFFKDMTTINCGPILWLREHVNA